VASTNQAATEILNHYTAKFPEMPTRALARLIFKKHGMAFASIDSVSQGVRARRGAHGKQRRKYQTAPAAPASRFNAQNPLALPQSEERIWEPFVMDGCTRPLVISDIHSPYFNTPALTCALQDGLRSKCDAVLINGDLIDFHTLSRFVKDPSKRRFKGEMETARALLLRIRELFPKARIVLKAGNHDDRFWIFMAERVPELLEDEEVQKNMSLAKLLHLDKLGIEYVGEKREVMLGRLPVLHGHEFRAGFAPPVNPARGAYLKAKDCVLVSHHHVTSENTVTTIGRKIITTWSIGCLCELRPAYDPFNGWNHGHAIVELSRGGDFHVQNKRQLDGRIL
jgi:predicted phosphodiesterase